MKCLAVTGVKGGVGKSTVAILLAKSFAEHGEKVVLADLDVECPNDYLLVGEKLKKIRTVYGEKPKLIKKKCKKCGICAKACKEHAIFWVENSYPVFFPDVCTGCGVCWQICPFGAIKPVKFAIGWIYKNRIRKNLWLITGKSKEGVTETSKVVKSTKEYALEFSKRIGAEYLIIDTAPGIRCNVIHTILGCDKAIAVTEPTPLGKHDLELCVKLTKEIGIKTSVVINKANLGRVAEIEKLAKKYGVKVEKKINYSDEILKAYTKGKLLEMKI